MTNRCPRRVDIVELLVEPGAHSELREHVAACPECSEEWKGLQRLTSMIAGSGSSVGTDMAGLLARVRHRRRRRLAVALGTSAFLVAGGVGAGASLGSTSTAVVAHTRTVTAAGPGPIVLVAQLTPRPWGTAVTLRAAGLPAKTVCELVAVGADGSGQPAGWWWSAHGAVRSVQAATSWHLGQLSRIELRIGGRTVAAATVHGG